MVQRSVIEFDVAKVADCAAKALAYEGYEQLYEGNMFATDSSVDFHWESGRKQPKATDVSQYFAEKEHLYTSHDIEVEAYENALKELVNHTKIFPATISNCDVQVSNKIVAKTVKVTVEFGFKVPGIVKYLGVEEDMIGMKSVGYEYTVNPTEFIRTADLAFDLGEFILNKLGFDVDGFLAKWSNVKKALGLGS